MDKNYVGTRGRVRDVLDCYAETEILVNRQNYLTESVRHAKKEYNAVKEYGSAKHIAVYCLLLSLFSLPFCLVLRVLGVRSIPPYVILTIGVPVLFTLIIAGLYHFRVTRNCRKYMLECKDNIRQEFYQNYKTLVQDKENMDSFEDGLHDRCKHSLAAFIMDRAMSEYNGYTIIQAEDYYMTREDHINAVDTDINLELRENLEDSRRRYAAVRKYLDEMEQDFIDNT